MKSMKYLLLLCPLLSACEPYIQTTSGASYLEKYKNAPTPVLGNGESLTINDQVRQVAAVEPTLQFPARIGVARIEYGNLTALTGHEVEIWEKAKKQLGHGFGDFVPLNPMIANMVSQSVGAPENDVMNKIRLGAARQHLDAVLIYEVYSKTDSNGSLLSIADLTIIGSYLIPSRAVEAEGFANALLIDVMQGYPYGTTNVTVEKEESYATSAGSYDAAQELSDSVKTKAVSKLSEEAVKMFETLRKELPTKRPQK